jgi:D-threo-aldose 1-dehydrogenase
LLQWRNDFFEVFGKFVINPAEACVQFALTVPGINVALNTTSPNRVKENIRMAQIGIPSEFWETLRTKGLIKSDYLSKSESVIRSVKSTLGKTELKL